MLTNKSGPKWLLAGALAIGLVLLPEEARASDEADVAPFMVMAAVFTVVIVVIAINSPVTDKTDDGSSGSTTEETSDAMRYAPVYERPRAAPMIGFTGRF